MYAILDIETTGGSPEYEKITEIAIYIHDGFQVVDEFHTLINPERSIPPFITRLTGISNEMVSNAPRFFEVAKKIVEITENKIIVAHNAVFDYSFIRKEFQTLGYSFIRPLLCTVRLSRRILPGYNSYSLGNLCKQLHIINEARHRAKGDAQATVRLFDLLLASDKNNFIRQQVQSDFSVSSLPPNLDPSTIHKLPDLTGVYYFHDEKGSLLYIGKSNNIRKRVLSHFASKANPKSNNIIAFIHDVSFELTGSELVALLLESSEIKRHQPRYNRMQRNSYYQYGIYKSVNESGYITLMPARLKQQKDEPLITCHNHDEAMSMLFSACEKHELCQKLCGLYDISYACFQHQVNRCHGACIGKEPVDDYNFRVQQLLLQWKLENKNIFIFGKGRTLNEQSIVGIENGKYIGFGYVGNDFTIASPDQARLFIQQYEDNRDVQRILCRHLLDPGNDRIVNWQ